MPQTSATPHIITSPRHIHFRDHSHKPRGECQYPNSPSLEFASATSLLRTVVNFTQRHSPSLSLARRDENVKAHFNLDFAFDIPSQPHLTHTPALSLLIRRLRRHSQCNPPLVGHIRRPRVLAFLATRQALPAVCTAQLSTSLAVPPAPPLPSDAAQSIDCTTHSPISRAVPAAPPPPSGAA